MARNRVIYQSEAVFVGPVANSPVQMKRVQSCNYNFSLERTDVNQFGELAAIDRIMLNEPTVAVDMTYIFDPSLANERTLGLIPATAGANFLSSIVKDSIPHREKNVCILTTVPGGDATKSTAEGSIAVGNAFLSSWSLEAAIGAFPTVSCAFQGQNITYAAGNSLPNPSFKQDGTAYGAGLTLKAVAYATSEVAAVKPGDVTVTLGASNSDNTPMFGLVESDLKVQSVTLSVALGREPIRKLGLLQAFSKELTTPITCTLSVSAVVGSSTASTLSNLSTLTTAGGDAATYDCTVAIKGWSTTSTPTATIATFTLRKAKINSQNVTSSIGPNKSVTIELTAQIGENSGYIMSSTMAGGVASSALANTFNAVQGATSVASSTTFIRGSADAGVSLSIAQSIAPTGNTVAVTSADVVAASGSAMKASAAYSGALTSQTDAGLAFTSFSGVHANLTGLAAANPTDIDLAQAAYNALITRNFWDSTRTLAATATGVAYTASTGALNALAKANTAFETNITGNVSNYISALSNASGVIAAAQTSANSAYTGVTNAFTQSLVVAANADAISV